MITNSAHRANTRRTRWAPTSFTSGCRDFKLWKTVFMHGDMFFYILIAFALIARMMLALAWLIAPICSLPQIFVFRLKTHPLMEEYRWTFFFKFWCSFFLLLILMVICQKFQIGILQTVHYHRLLRREIFQSG